MQFRDTIWGISGGINIAIAALGAALAVQHAQAQQPQPLYRVHAGGEAFVDAAGHVWEADRLYTGGSLFMVGDSIEGTPDQALYRTERWNDPAMGNLQYVFDVREGDYLVRLHFAEIWEGAFTEGSRVFDVSVNGQVAAQGVDIYARAGARKPMVLEQPVPSSQGKITVEFFNQVGHAKVSGIEVIPVNPFRAQKAPYRIHCGGEDFVDADGKYWEADGHFQGGWIYGVSAPVTNTVNSLLYQTERWNPDGQTLAYSFDVEEGSYSVRLHFAEIYFTEPGARVFGIDINGAPVEEALDIVAAAGANTALVKEYAAAAVDGKVTIGLRNGVHHAKINAIEVLPANPVGLRRPEVGGAGAKASHPGPGSWRWRGADASGGPRDLRGKATPRLP